MLRVVADLPDEDARWVAETAAVLGRSRASIIREAVAFFGGAPKAERTLPGLSKASAHGRTAPRSAMRLDGSAVKERRVPDLGTMTTK